MEIFLIISFNQQPFKSRATNLDENISTPNENGKPSKSARSTAPRNQQAKNTKPTTQKGLFDKLIDLGEEGMDIRKIWVKSSTVPGIKLSRDLGFTELGYINNEQIGFVLDLETADLPAIKKYQEVLENTAEVGSK